MEKKLERVGEGSTLGESLARLERLAATGQLDDPDDADAVEARPDSSRKPKRKDRAIDPTHTRYDGGLAEFPAFRFGTKRSSSRETIQYSDTIIGPEGQPLTRRWTVHPGPDGYGGAFAQGLLFDLHQLWKEQGFQGTRIYYGTLRQLFQRARPELNPGPQDYARLRRNLDILCGYQFDCEGSFWDPVTKSYGNMRRWSLFTGWYDARQRWVSSRQEELPLGFVEVSDTFARVSRERGFFVTGFDSPFFHSLSPREQRLALYLSKMFASQTLHRRAVDTLCSALPLEAQDEKKRRQTLKEAAEGLVNKGYPYLSEFSFSRSQSSRNWIAEFRAPRRVDQDYVVPRFDPRSLDPRTFCLVQDIVEACHDQGSEYYWSQVIHALGEEPVRAALSELRGDLRESRVTATKSRGALLNTRIQRMARERGISLDGRP